ncbi:MAG TPA: hypothetical protein VJ814_08635 [Gaiellaceae bacterium]|nr:hypothetical protein [Gaiellaceae bacterium]
MVLLLLALLVIAAVAGGFVIHWLFIAAVVLALLWAISFFAGGIEGRRAGWRR